MLEKLIICISGKKTSLIEISKDHSNVVETSKSKLASIAEMILANKTKVYVLVLPGYKDQETLSVRFPFFSYINIKNLINQIKQERCGYKKTISEHFFLEKSYDHSCVAFVFAELQKELVKLIERVKPNFCGVFFAFLECQTVLQHLFNDNTKNLKLKNKKNIKHVALLYTKPNSLAIITQGESCEDLFLKNIDLNYETDESIAGEIIQKTEDIMSAHTGKINFAIVAPKQISRVISEDKDCQNFTLLTPYQAAILFGAESFFDQDERFADLLFASNIILNNKTYQSFSGAQKYFLQNAKRHKLLNHLILFFLVIILSLLPFYEVKSSYYTSKMKINSEALTTLSNKLSKLELQLSNLVDESKEKISFYRLFQKMDDGQISFVEKINQNLKMSSVKCRFANEPEGKTRKMYMELQIKEKADLHDIKKQILQECKNCNVLIKQTKEKGLYIEIEK